MLLDADSAELPHVSHEEYDSYLASRTEPLVISAKQLSAPLPRVSYDDLATSNGVRRWLTHLLVDGVVIVHGTPNERGQVLKLADLVGYARPTNFGVLFDVESKPDPTNSAYTAMGLEVHSDLPNYAAPPDYQFLHALSNDAEGGDSILADAFAAAEQLRVANPAAFEVLATWPVPFRYHDTSDDIRYRAPTFQITNGSLTMVRFNNWIRDVDLDATGHDGERFYDAYQAYWLLLREPDNRVNSRLSAGDVLCFDNRRMLHGRTAFNPNTGHRHLQGCYVDQDMVESRLRMLTVG
jgi:gamma-butyrobetaine dioxygenase